MRKRLLSLALSAVMAVSMLSGVSITAKADTGKNDTTETGSGTETNGKDKYGFNLSVPSSFDANDGENPYGNGYSAFNKKMEAFLWYRSSNDNRNAQTYNYTQNGQITGNSKIGPGGASGTLQYSVLSGKTNMKYVNLDAYDAYGSGHDNMVVAVGATLGKSPQLMVARYSASGNSSDSRQRIIDLGSGDDNDWLRDSQLEKYSANKNYFAVKAGDFDGDGDEDVAVYVPRRGNPYVILLDGRTLEPLYGNGNSQIYLSSFMGSVGAQMAGKFTNNGKTSRATINMSIETADVDRDGVDELLLLGSYSDIHDDSDGKKLTARSSVLAYCKTDGQPRCSQKFTFDKNIFQSDIYLRYASVAAGDIDYDGYPEIVVAGEFTTKDGPNGDGSIGSNKKYIVATLDSANKDGKLSVGPSSQIEMSSFVKTGYDADDCVHPLPALTCVAVNGRNDAEQIFLDGLFLKYDGSSWSVDYTAKTCRSSDRGIGGYIISDTWVDNCVAGNFDENDLGIEQVMYTTGYKERSRNQYFYRVQMSGKTQKNNSDGTSCAGDYADSETNELVRHVGMSDYPCITLAAVDADNDTDVFTYTSKKYTYSNVDVMAVLQAAPYFDELKDDYFNGTLGETLYGKTSGSGTASQKTSSTSVGAYVSVSVEAPFMKFQSETSFTHEWEKTYEDELSTEYTISFGNDGTKNQVVLYRTPVILYDYIVTPADGSEPYTMTVGIQKQPVYTTMDVDTFNNYAKDDETIKDKVITQDVLSSVPGRPDTYPNSSFGLLNFAGYPNAVEVNNQINDQTTISMNITDSQQSSVNMTQTNNFEVSVGVGNEFKLGSVKGEWGAGVTAGHSWGSGKTTFDYSSISKEGVVAHPPKTESQYSFSARFGAWQAKIGNSVVPVLGYVVNNVVQPPSPPQDVSIDTLSSDSITVAWEHGYKSADTYEVYQVFDDGVTDNQYSLLATISGNDTTYTYTGLAPATNYQLALRSVGTDSDGETVYSEYTPAITARTLSEGERPIISGMTDSQHVIVGGTATFAIDALPSESARGGLAYSWQIRKAGDVNWTGLTSADASGIGTSTLKLKNVTEDMNGNHYRCVVSELIKGVRLYSYGSAGSLQVGKADSSVKVTAVNTEPDSADNGTNRAYAQTTRRETRTLTREITKTLNVKVGGAAAQEYVEYSNIAENSDSSLVKPEKIYMCTDDSRFYILEDLSDNESTASGKILIDQVTARSFDSADENTDHFDGIDADSMIPVTAQVSEAVTETIGDGTQQEVIYYAYDVTDADGNEYTFYSKTAGTPDGVWYEAEVDVDSDSGSLVMKSGNVTASAYSVIYETYRESNDDGSESNQEYETVDGKNWYKYWPSAHEGDERYVLYSDATGTQFYYKTIENVTDSGDEDVKDPESGDSETGDVGTGDSEGSGTGTDSGGKTAVQKTVFKELHVSTVSGYTLEGEKDSLTYIATPGQVSTVTETYNEDVDVVKPGDKTTISINVSAIMDGVQVIDKTGVVRINLINNQTGSVTEVSADVNASGDAVAVWYPEETGDYTITASFGGNDSLYPSDGQTVFYVVTPDDKNMYVLSGNSVEYGKTISLSVEAGEISQDADVVTKPVGDTVTVKYQVAYKDGDGELVTKQLDDNKFVPLWAGTHTFTATITADGKKYYAKKTVNVSKRNIQISAPSAQNISEDDKESKVPALSDVKIIYQGNKTENGILERDREKFSLEKLMRLETEPELNGDSEAGSYQTRLLWLTKSDEESDQYTEHVDQFLRNYNVTLNQGSYKIVTDQYTVFYEADGNGSVRAYYGDGREPFASGDSLKGHGKVSFVAAPKENYSVKKWVVTDGEGKTLTLDEDYTVKGNTLSVTSLARSMYVSVIFEVDSYKVTYEAGENGTVVANYLVDGQLSEAIDSGEMAVAGKKIRFTAEPEDGYIVKQWMITEEGQSSHVKNDEDGLAYMGNTLDIDSLKAGTVVSVEFEPVSSYMVETGIMSDDETNSVAGCGIKISGADEDGKVIKGCQVSFAADNPGSVTVAEWRAYNDDGSYKVLASGKPECTITNLQQNVKVVMVVHVTQSQKLHFEAVDDDGQKVTDVITAQSGDVEIQSDMKLLKDVSVSFAADIPEQYQAVEWKLYTGENETVLAAGKDAVKAELKSSNEPMRVILTLAKRPQLTYSSGENGTVTCEKYESGKYIDKYDTEPIEIVLTPESGYEADEAVVTVDGKEYTDFSRTVSDDLLYETLKINAPEGGFTDDIDVSVTFKKITTVISATYSLEVIDTPVSGKGIMHGTMSASVSRGTSDTWNQTGSAVGDGMDEQTVTLDGIYRDSVITFKALPDKGYNVKEWRINGVVVDSWSDTVQVQTDKKANDTLSITVDGDSSDIEVSAKLELSADVLTFGAEDSGTGSVNAVVKASRADIKNGQMIGTSTSVLFTASPSDNYELVGWKINGILAAGETGNEFNYIVKAGVKVDVRAVFDRRAYSVSWSADDGGSLKAGNVTDDEELEGGSANVRGGRILEFEATADENMEFAGYTVNYNGTKRDYTAAELADGKFVTEALAADIAVTAHFKKIYKKYTVTYASGDSKTGKVAAVYGNKNRAIASGKQVTEGENISFTATPADGYMVEGWYGDAEFAEKIAGTDMEQNKYSVAAIGNDLTVYVKFVPISEYQIKTGITGAGRGTLTAKVNGRSVDASSGQITVRRHDRVELTVKPYDEYNFVTEWTVDDLTSLSDELTYKINDVTADSSVYATVSPSLVVEVKYDGEKTVDHYSAVRVEAGYNYDDMSAVSAERSSARIAAGKNVRFTITPEDGYMVDGWKVTYIENGSVIKTDTDFGYDETITIDRLASSISVSAIIVPKKGYSIPAEGEYGGYIISDVQKTPDGLKFTDEEGNILENMVRENGQTTFTVSPAKGRRITSIRYSGKTTSGENVFTVTPLKDEKGVKTGSYKVTIDRITQDVKLSIKAVKQYTVTMPKCKNGNVIAKTASGRTIASGTKVDEGTMITFTAKPSTHYELSKWTYNAAGKTGTSFTMKVTGNTKIAAEFKVIYVKVKIESPVNGKITVKTSAGKTVKNGQRVAEGTVLVCTATASTGCVLKKWMGSVSGNSKTVRVTAGKSLTIGASFVAQIPAQTSSGINTNIRASYKTGKLTVAWGKVNAAAGYDIYMQRCLTNYTDKGIVKTVKGSSNTQATLTALGGKPLSKYEYVKVMVKAYKYVNGKKKYIDTSAVIHVVCKSSKYTNAKTMKLGRTSYTLAVKQTANIKVSYVKVESKKKLIDKTHGAYTRFYTSNKNVATVDSNGKITAKAAGTCTVYVVSISGITRAVKVTVR